MKKITFPVVLVAMFGMVAASCQKETMLENQTLAVENGTVYTVRYTLNGVTYTERMNSDAEYEALILRLVALAKEGYEVEVWDGDCSCQFDATKDIVTYNTTSESDAAAWALARAREGYHVTISYNERTGVYTCIGIK
jgi:hypothetical protein